MVSSQVMEKLSGQSGFSISGDAAPDFVLMELGGCELNRGSSTENKAGSWSEKFSGVSSRKRFWAVLKQTFKKSTLESTSAWSFSALNTR